MPYEDHLLANTDLTPEAIHDVLFKDVDIQNDEEWPGWIKGSGFDCYVSHNPPWRRDSLYLQKPITLQVDFRYSGGSDNAMRVVSNWLNDTDADTVFESNGEFLALLRIDGRLIKNIHPNSSYFQIPNIALDLADLPYIEADRGDWLVGDEIYVESVDDTQQIMENYCQHLFDDHETKIDQGLTAVQPQEVCARVERDAFRIGTFRFHPFKWSLKWKRGDDRYPFLANFHIDVFYTKGRGIPLMTDGAYDVSIRDMTLRGVAGLIRTTEYNLVLEFSDPKRDVLMYHAGELTLYEDSCWTEERLALFEGIPYKFSAPIP